MSSNRNDFLTPVTENDMITVKSDLVLISEDGQGHTYQKKKSGRHGTPSFHIDPEDVRLEGVCHPTSTLFKALLVCLKLIFLVFLLYFFVTSLDLLASAFRLIGGRTASAVFQKSALLSNPVVGLMIGVLVTVIVQSSSTSSSIIVSMVAADFLEVKTAIPIIMGANIGTSLTNTLVSFGQIHDREQFEKAFAGATVHDMFNWLSVLVLLPIEVATNYLYLLTHAVLSGINFEQKDVNIELLSKITKPFTNKIVQLEKKVLDSWSMNDESYTNATLLKLSCSDNVDGNKTTCDHLAAYIGLSDLGTGVILLLLSIFILCFCLIGIVKILGSFLKGTVASVIQKFVNADLPYVPFLTGYLALLIGAVMTFLLQSSSIFTSSLTPLIGLGVIKLERAYPLTLGSNIGTTTTALLASLTADPRRLKPAIQVALVHMFFNVNGILLFYPIPFMRFPIGMAKYLGRLTAKHRWFSVVYMLLCFLVLPGFVFSVSLGGSLAMMGVFIPLIVFIVTIIAINLLQKKCPQYLPKVLRDWAWCPRWLKSLEPIEEAVMKVCCQGICKNTSYLPVQRSTNQLVGNI